MECTCLQYVIVMLKEILMICSSIRKVFDVLSCEKLMFSIM